MSKCVSNCGGCVVLSTALRLMIRPVVSEATLLCRWLLGGAEPSLLMVPNPARHSQTWPQVGLLKKLLGGWVTDYCVSVRPVHKMCQNNECERSANQSRLRETRLVLKLYSQRFIKLKCSRVRFILNSVESV